MLTTSSFLVLDLNYPQFALGVVAYHYKKLLVPYRSVHFAAVLFTTILVVYHANLVLTGQTTFESNHRVEIYNLGWRQNLVEVFGTKWRLAAIWPFVSSRNSFAAFYSC